MALPGKSAEDLAALSIPDRDAYFDAYARYSPETPAGHGWQYTIRIGSRILHSDDTYQLKLQFIRAMAALKASHTRESTSKHRKR